MQIRLAGIIDESVADGPGIRMVFFAQGCRHLCPGCHNPETHDESGGVLHDTDELCEKIAAHPFIAGITLSGGEPLLQAAACAELAAFTHQLNKTVLVYSGYTFEELMEMASADQSVQALLDQTDVLIDGPFILEERNIDLTFRGSPNQRIIDLPRSMQEGEVIELKLGRDAWR